MMFSSSHLEVILIMASVKNSLLPAYNLQLYWK